MLQVQFLRENKQSVVRSLKMKSFDASTIIDKVIELDDNRKSTQSSSDDLLARANSIAKEIGVLFKSGKGEEANSLKEESSQIKEKTKVLQSNLSEIESEITINVVTAETIQ